MEALIAILLILVVVALLYEVAENVGIPYPALLVLGGLALAFVPNVPRIDLQPEFVLLLFLPPLLFSAAMEIPLREFRANLGPIARLSIGLVAFTTLIVAAVAQAVVPGLGWGPALALGAILAPTDAIAATTVFRRLHMPRQFVTILEGESLVNDASALVLYRAAVLAVVTGTFVLADALLSFVVSPLGGIAMGVIVGAAAKELVKRVDNPPVEVAIGLAAPFAAYLPADAVGVSGVLAAVSAGLIFGRKLGSVMTPNSRLLWVGSWRMIGFILNGFVFVLIGTALPDIISELRTRPLSEVALVTAVVVAVVIGTRVVWVAVSSLLPNSPRRRIAERDPSLAWRLVFMVGWSGLRGAVSLAAALALPQSFPERDLILFLTFVVILVTLVGQGLTLPSLIRIYVPRARDWDEDELELAQGTAYRAGLEAIERLRPKWPTHQPLFDNLQSSIVDRKHHLATDDPDETAERRQERKEHIEIQRYVITAQRVAVTELRDTGQINDETLRAIERELDLDEIRMEG